VDGGVMVKALLVGVEAPKLDVKGVVGISVGG
jgi:hypothetical protein